MLNDGVAHWPWPVVEFGIGSDHRTGFQATALNPFQPVVKDKGQSPQTAGCLHRRNKRYLVIAAYRFIERGDLQFLLGAKVRKESTLGQPRLLGKAADGERIESMHAGVLDGGFKDQGAGFFALGRFE